MDQKSWLWKKKSTENIILATDKLNISQKGNEEEIQSLVPDKLELENELKILNNKLASTLSDCNYKDELMKKHENMALQATEGREKAESEVESLKRELDEALQLRVASEERITNLDAALKECMRQLRFVREEHEKRIHDALTKASEEFEISRKNLEEQLAETRKRLARLGVENTGLSKALSAKEKVIDDLNKQRALTETDLNALIARLDSTEKDNAALKYEVRVVEKELEIRNEEREFNRRTAEATHKQQLESVKKIAKLESECQRLRVLVRKRLPGPAALAKMKNEVEMLGKDSVEMRRKLNLSPKSPRLDFVVDDYSDSPSKRISILTEQLHEMEEENRALMEALNTQSSELQLSRAMYARTASKLSEVESRFDESSKSLPNNESSRNSLMLSSMSDVGIEDKASSAGSWASALISEIEHFRNGQLRKPSSGKTVVSSEINLMDDFAEMEKLALVSVDKLSVSSRVSLEEANGTLGSIQTESNGKALEVMCKETVLVHDSQSDHSMLNNEMKSESLLLNNVPCQFQDILKAILVQSHATQRNPDEILEDIRKALASMSYTNTAEIFDGKEVSDRPNSCCISGYMSRQPLNGSSKVDSCDEDADVNIFSEQTTKVLFHPDLSKSICRIIELIEGISLPSPDYSISETLSEKKSSYKHSETPSGYMARVFQWKTSELSAVLQQFVQACYDLLNDKTNLNKFTQELTSVLDWIINHCFSLQDVSSMRDAIKNNFDWDESQSENESDVGIVDQFAPYDKDDKNFFQEEEPNVKEENRKLHDELINQEVIKEHPEDKLQSTPNRSDYLINELEESEIAIAKLQEELHTLRKTEEMVEGQVEKPKGLYEIFDNPLSSPKYELDDACQKFPSQGLQSKKKGNCHEDLVATCLDSVKEKEIPNLEAKQDGNQFRTNWEITAASEKLAECQETILNLGKQLKALASPKKPDIFDLKALASPKKADIFDNVISTPTEPITPTTSITILTPARKMSLNQRPSLLDQMIIEDEAKRKGNLSSSFVSKAEVAIVPTDNVLVLKGNKQKEDNDAVKSLAIVPRRKQGGSLWKKLLRKMDFTC